MFGTKNATGAKTLVGGILMTIFQTMLTRKLAGRAAGVAARGGGGLPGLVIWLAVSYLFNRYMNGREGNGRPAPTPARTGRLASARR